MSISTYSDLTDAIAEWLARESDTTLVARVPDFVTLTEGKLNRLLRCHQMEKRSTTTVNTSTTEPEFITLPSDFQIMRRVRLSSVEGKPRLDFLTGTQADEYRYSRKNVTGRPGYFTVFGTEMELLPTPDENYTIEMVYRANIPALSSSASQNWLLSLAPDVYLYGALLEASPYMRDDERIAAWQAMFDRGVAELNQLSKEQTYNAGPLMIRLTGPTP